MKQVAPDDDAASSESREESKGERPKVVAMPGGDNQKDSATDEVDDAEDRES